MKRFLDIAAKTIAWTFVAALASVVLWMLYEIIKIADPVEVCLILIGSALLYVVGWSFKRTFGYQDQPH